MTAFVTDGDERPALAVARSLARQGVSVIVGAPGPTSLASRSRACARHVTYPSPYRHPEQFDRFLLDFVRRERVSVVVPVTEVTTYLVSRNRRVLLPHAAVAAPSFEAFDGTADKALLVDRAIAAGVPVPRTESSGRFERTSARTAAAANSTAWGAGRSCLALATRMRT